MQLKKNPKADLENKKGLFIEIGLAVAIALVVIVFSVSQSEKTFEKMNLEGDLAIVEMIDMTQERPQEQQQARPTVSVITDVINVVRNDVRLHNDNFTFTDFDENVEVVPLEIHDEVIIEDAPFLVAEDMPTFNGGGLEVFRKWVESGVEYPNIAKENGIQGTVVLTFVIEKNGKLTNIEVLQTPDRVLSDAAIARVAQSPTWVPAKQRGVPVRLRYNMPVVFRLAN